MKKVSNEFINLSKKVKTQDLKLTINDGELTVQEVHFMPVNIFNSIPVSRLRARKEVIAKELKYSFEGQLFKTIMQQIEITVKNASEIKGKKVDFKYGILINNEFEYVDMGEYYIKDVEDDKNKEELVVTGYDKMLNFMIPFKQSDLKLTYPCKMGQLVNRMGEVCGVELYSTDFYNSDLIVDEDFFTIQELTYRDVLEKIAQTTLTTIFIKENKLYLCKIGESVQTLDTSFLSNLVIGEKFGPVNALVLGRGSVEDNIESVDQQSINTNGRCEIRFDENEFVDSKREQVIYGMLQQINGLEYYAIEASNLGILWLEPCDVIIAKDREESEYKTIYLKASVTINTGIEGEMEADIPEETTTEYKVTTKGEKKTLKVERLAKKNEGLIQDIIEENKETSNKLSQHEQTIDSMKDTLKSQETKIETVESKANNAQKTADANTTKITTNTTKITEVEKTVDGISQKVSTVEENLTDNYYNKKETDTKFEETDSNIELLAEEINTITGDNNIKNGEFNNSLDNWGSSAYNGSVTVQKYNNKNYANLRTRSDSATLSQIITGMFADMNYKLSFDAFDNGDYFLIESNATFKVKIYQIKSGSEEAVVVKEQQFTVTETEKNFNLDFTLDEDNGQVIIYFDLKTNSYLAGEVSLMITNVVLSGGNVTEKLAKLNISIDGINTEVSKKVGNDEIISKINQSSESISINANRVSLNRKND